MSKLSLQLRMYSDYIGFYSSDSSVGITKYIVDIFSYSIYLI